MNDVQESCGVLFGNKLKKHKAWDKHNMNESLAAQTLIQSAAYAMNFLNLELQLPEFKNSHSTLSSVHKIDAAFDMLNSQHPYGTGSKAKVSLKNLVAWRYQAKDHAEFIFDLIDQEGLHLRTDVGKLPFGALHLVFTP